MFILKWTNKFSGETGYVQSISAKESHFNNTFEAGDAKRYKTEKSANQAIKTLSKYGECDNNNFEVCPA